MNHEDRQYEKSREVPGKLSMRTDIINSMMAEKSAKTVGPGAAVPMKLFAAAWELEKTAQTAYRGTAVRLPCRLR